MDLLATSIGGSLFRLTRCVVPTSQRTEIWIFRSDNNKKKRHFLPWCGLPLQSHQEILFSSTFKAFMSRSSIIAATHATAKTIAQRHQTKLFEWTFFFSSFGCRCLARCFFFFFFSRLFVERFFQQMNWMQRDQIAVFWALLLLLLSSF